MMADRTFLASIGRIDEHYRHASQGCLVVNKLSELMEAPIMLLASLRSLNRASFSYALKVFQGNQRRSVFGLRNQLFGDAMVCVSVESSLFARKLLKMSFGALCTTVLKICFEVIYLGSDFLSFLSREYLSSRIDRDVLDAKIDAKSTLWLDFLRYRNINHDTEIERTSSENEIGLTSNPVKPRSMVITDQDGQLDSTVESQQRDPIKSFPRHDSLIVDNSSIRLEYWLDRFVSLVGFGCFGDCPNSHLSGDTKLFSDLMINNLLQFDFIGCMKFKSLLSDEVAGGVKLMHSLKKGLMLFGRGFKFNLKSLHHSIDIKNLWKYKGYGRSCTAFPLKDGASCLLEVKRITDIFNGSPNV